MLNLLKFYIPNVVKNILFIFTLAIGVSVALLISPLSQDMSEKIIGVIFFLILPVYTYFNPSNYLSASLGWILQTPISKKSVILANGIINLFKIVFILILVNLLYFVAGKASKDSVPLIEFFEWLYTDDKTTYSNYAVQDQFFLVFVITGSVIILFGILPDLLNNAQERRNQHEQLSLKSLKPKKIFNYLVGFVFLFIFFFSESNNLIPPFILYNFVLSTLILSSIVLTLKSVKYIYRIAWPIGLAIGIFLLGSLLSYNIAQRQIIDPSIALDKRIETADFLGHYGGNSYDLIFSEISSGHPSTIDIGRSDLVVPVLMAENEMNVESSVKALEILCKERSDHTCRLYGYIVSIKLGKKVPAEIARLGCPNDLGSCSLLGNHADAKEEDIKLADSIMNARCKDSSSPQEGKICKSYYEAKARAEKRSRTKS